MVGRVSRDWKASFPEGIQFRTGNRVRLEKFDPEWPGWGWCVLPSGAGAWTPLSMIDPGGDLGGPLPVQANLLEDYDSTELTVQAGERVEVLREANGWYWAEDASGQRGWIPVFCVELD
jgi:hypothetical protein